MNLFLRKTVLFFTIPFCLLILLLISLNYINNRSLANYRVKNHATSIFMGDSHVRLAINDGLLTDGVNLSQHSESTLFSYFKIKAILQNNPSIKRVYLGFSYHSISSYYDDAIYGKSSKHIAAKYFFILPFEEKILILQQNSNALPTFLKNILINGLSTLFAKDADIPFLGKYENGFNNTFAVESSMDKRLLLQFYENGQLRDFSFVTIDYLYKIIDLCKKDNVELIILNTPLNKYYKSKMPQKFMEKYNAIIEQNKLKCIDFNNLTFNDSCFIPDGDHVSETGAILTTNQFK